MTAATEPKSAAEARRYTRVYTQPEDKLGVRSDRHEAKHCCTLWHSFPRRASTLQVRVYLVGWIKIKPSSHSLHIWSRGHNARHFHGKSDLCQQLWPLRNADALNMSAARISCSFVIVATLWKPHHVRACQWHHRTACHCTINLKPCMAESEECMQQGFVYCNNASCATDKY